MIIDDGNQRQLNHGEKEALRPHAINCDQVHWLLCIADRYLGPQEEPRAGQKREMLKYAMLYEIMETAGLKFLDDSARRNGTPNQVRKYDV